ncbi:unnamed protein product [Brassica napus]|uniref:(rape) hypothetical protein n=1 Tax=Brassica napus TaxID=3708 RepID=A0A816M0K2_BRANA|nr:unnamed protein product [Brassica napus]CAF1983090.1 unnamed protein product [Brassica napus]
MKLWLRAPLVNSDGDSKDAFPNNLVYVLNGCVFCFAVGVLHVMLKRGFAFSVYNMNILLEGLCKNLEYDKTVTLLLELKLNVEIEAPTLESEGSSAQEIKNFLKRFEVGSGPLLRCSNNEFNTIEHIGRLLLFSDLLSFQRFKEFYASTTISTEDEPYKGLSNLLAPAGDLFSYLDDLANSLDIQAYIRECVWTAGN